MANGDNMPKPEPIWISFGIFAAAVVIASDAKWRRRFFKAARALTAAHQKRERVVAFGAGNGNRATLSRSIKGGVAWVLRFMRELDDGAER